MHAQSSILGPTSPTPHTNLATKRLTSYPPDIKSPITYSDLGEGEPHGRANYPLCSRTQPSRIRNSAVNAPRSRITSNSPTDPSIRRPPQGRVFKCSSFHQPPHVSEFFFFRGRNSSGVFIISFSNKSYENARRSPVIKTVHRHVFA